MLDLIASVLVKWLNRFFQLLPARFNLMLGGMAGRTIYCLSAKRRRVAYSNMKAAFGGEYTPLELRGLVKKVYVNMGATFMEIFTMTRVNSKYVERYVDRRNWPRLEEAARNSRGMILLSAHFGNWEMSTVVSVLKGYPLHMLARDQKMERLNELLNLLRESKGNKVIRKGYDIKEIFRLLRRGESVGILGDQNAGVNGRILPFFGRPASIAVGPFRFAQKTGAVILPAVFYRVKGPYYRLDIHEAMRIGRDEDIEPYMRRYNRILEGHIREHPEQWLWMHKKWKACPLKRILILDDGRKGHLRQSQAVASLLERHRLGKGYAEKDVEIVTVPFRYKGSFHKMFLKVWVRLFTRNAPGRLKVLAFALEEASYKELCATYADVVVSTGSAAHPVNRITAIDNDCHNVTVMDPGRFARKWFDLVIIPGHDTSERTGVHGKVIVTELAPNLVRAPVPVRPKEKSIGLLFGGDNKAFGFTREYVETLAGMLKRFLNEGYTLEGTTSRRTGKAFEEALFAVLEGLPGCGALVRGSLDGSEHTVRDILQHSEKVLVSAESISMVSEAVSSGREVIALVPPLRFARARKHEGFIETLRDKGYILVARNVDEAAALISRPHAGGPDGPVIPDDELILGEAGRLF